MLGFSERDLDLYQHTTRPPAEYIDGMGIVPSDTYQSTDLYQHIYGSGVTPEYKDRVLMRGTRHCLKHRHSWNCWGSSTWGGFATAFTQRYLRRYYKDTIFFDRDQIDPILRKIAERYWMHPNTERAYRDSFRITAIGPCSSYRDTFNIIFRGKTLFLNYQQYKMCLSIYKQVERLDKLEQLKNETEED